MKPFRLFLLAAAFASASVALAQSMVVRTITFVGAPQSQEELLKLSGLTPGKSMTKDDLEAATHRLDDSGLFMSVQYSSVPGAVTFTLEPVASSQMQKVRYVNFPWFTTAEITDGVHVKLPMFTGAVPGDGQLKEEVARALEALVKQRGVNATVETQDVAGGIVAYRIASPQVTVTDVQIENIRWNSDPVLDSVYRALIGVEYDESLSQRGVHDNVDYALKELGFLDENVGPIGHAEPRVDGARISVVMTGAATPGSRYKVLHVTLPAAVGTVPASELESEHQVKPGGLPSPSLVINTVARMAFVFAGHGFLDAKASVDTTRDATAHTINYTFTVVPGEVYQMRDLLFATDLSADQKDKLAKAWKLPKGAVYERAIAERSLLSLNTLCAGRPAFSKPGPDPATHQTDVSLSCKPQR